MMPIVLITDGNKGLGYETARKLIGQDGPTGTFVSREGQMP